MFHIVIALRANTPYRLDNCPDANILVTVTLLSLAIILQHRPLLPRTEHEAGPGPLSRGAPCWIHDSADEEPHGRT